MKQAERIERIEKLVKVVEAIKARRDAGEKIDTSKYRGYLDELAKLRRIENGFNSIFVFGQTYFSSEPPHDLIRPETPSPQFHIELCDLLRETAMSVKTKKMAVAAPRSHAKSVWDTNIFPVWLVAYKDDIPTDPYWCIIGDCQENAGRQLEIVKMAIESNEKFIADFGNLRGDKKWNVSEVITANGVKFDAIGITESPRGRKYGSYRPSLIFDDIETTESAGTPERIEKIITNFDKTFLPLGDPNRSKFVLVGTIISYGSLLNQVMTRRGDWRKIKYRAIITMPTNMHLWQEWANVRKDFSHGATPEESTEVAEQRAVDFYEQHHTEMDEGAVVLWPERLSLYMLMVIRDTNRMAFLSEYLNDPLDSETRMFKNIVYYAIEDVNQADLDFFYACDPSVGRNRRADYSAIVVVGKNRRSGVMYVMEADIRRRSPDRIILDLFEKHKRYSFKNGWVEGVAFQEFFRQEVLRRSAESGVYIPANEFRTGNVNKEIRIAGIEPLVTNGYVRFLPSQVELVAQLEYFPKHDRFDGPDALAMVLEGIRSGSKPVVWGKL